MLHYSILDYIKGFWFNSGAGAVLGSEVFSAFEAALVSLIRYGRQGKGYMKFCSGLPIAETRTVLRDYKIFLTKHADETIVRRVLAGANDIWDGLSDFEALQYTAGHIRRVMRQYHFRDKDNPRFQSVAFTGPRPEKLPRGLDWEKLRTALSHTIEQTILEGYSIFSTGMCRGIDLLAGRCVMDQKEHYPHIQLICAVPFAGQANHWPERDKAEYNSLLKLADKTELLSGARGYRAYHLRNEWMIDHSDRLIAVYDGKSGDGTGFTVGDAGKMGLETIFINPDMFICTPG